uniref:Uncharacterized protein n=1 Tax=Rhizophora mucronata TaxID=61149 RepID=A0A2P2N716_RHIMU
MVIRPCWPRRNGMEGASCR